MLLYGMDVRTGLYTNLAELTNFESGCLKISI